MTEASEATAALAVGRNQLVHRDVKTIRREVGEGLIGVREAADRIVGVVCFQVVFPKGS